VAEIVLTQAHSGQTVQAKPGDMVIIRLAENPTTGYRWEIAAGPVLSGDEFAVAGGAPGAGGERVLRFSVAGPGRTQVSAVLRRQWESGATPQARFDVMIEAH